MAIVFRAPEFIVQGESSKRSPYHGFYSITWYTSGLSYRISYGICFSCFYEYKAFVRNTFHFNKYEVKNMEKRVERPQIKLSLNLQNSNKT